MAVGVMYMREKDCYCCNCDKEFHHLGIARHRAMHRDRVEDCRIIYSNGIARNHYFVVKPSAREIEG